MTQGAKVGAPAGRSGSRKYRQKNDGPINLKRDYSLYLPGESGYFVHKKDVERLRERAVAVRLPDRFFPAMGERLVFFALGLIPCLASLFIEGKAQSLFCVIIGMLFGACAIAGVVFLIVSHRQRGDAVEPQQDLLREIDRLVEAPAAVPPESYVEAALGKDQDPKAPVSPPPKSDCNAK